MGDGSLSGSLPLPEPEKEPEDQALSQVPGEPGPGRRTWNQGWFLFPSQKLAGKATL